MRGKRLWLLRLGLGFALAGGCGALSAQDVSIRNVTRSVASGWVQVDGGWVQRAEVLRVRFQVSEPFKGELPITAGFFDSEGKLLRKIASVPRIVARGDDYQSLPSQLEAGRAYEIFFPIPPSLATGPGRWRHFVIRLGDGETPASAVYPGGPDAETFSFQSERGGISASADAVVVDPVIRQIVRYRNANNAWVDKTWKSNLTTLRVRVRLNSGADAGGFFARAYFFGSDGKLLFSHKKPPEVEVRRGQEYVSLPPIWRDNTDYEIHFPVPDDYERGDKRWRTAVVVFGNSGQAVAATFPTTANPADFEFPEKSLALGAEH